MPTSDMSKSNDLETLVGIFAWGVAEYERGLSAYFVETPAWEQLRNDQKNVLLGAKGSGKSALFTLLTSDTTASLPKGTVVIGAERPINEMALFKEFFQRLAETPAPDTILPQEFQFLWKAYFLILIASELQKRDITNEHTRTLVNSLRDLGLVPPDEPNRLAEALKKVVAVVLRGEIKLGNTMDQHGSVSQWISLSWRERLHLSPDQKRKREASLERLTQLFDSAEAALAHARPEMTFWLALDRLDDVFPDADTGDLERDALGALLNVYMDLQTRRYDHLRLKVFLRSDIFRRITRHHGFKNLDHVEPSVYLTWPDEQLMSLIVLRCAQSDRVRARYGLPESVTKAVQLLRSDKGKRETLFQRIFPVEIETQDVLPQGRILKLRKLKPMTWLREQLADADNEVAPRDVIKLIGLAIDGQLAAGDTKSPQRLFSSAPLKAAAARVSIIHFDTVFRAEYHRMVPYVEALKRGSFEYSLEELGKKWAQFMSSPDEVETLANELAEERFFTRRPIEGDASGYKYIVAPLYRSALELRSENKL